MPDEATRRVHAANQRYHSAMADQYDETQPYFSAENRRRVRAILAQLGGGRLLDIGCGTGFIERLAHDLFEQCVGVDMTPAMLARAPRQPGLDYVMAVTEALPFAAGSFDVVVIYSVLHHFVDLPAIAAEARRVLRAGGAFYADESPNAHCATALAQAADMEGLDELLAGEVSAVLSDHQRYQERFGLDEETVRSAMYRKYAFGGIDEDELREVLLDAGFTDIRFEYRWPVGGSRLVREGGWEQVQAIEAHLRGLLPLTRHLFKYVQVTAF
jgi:ubiquinone/menaquinone biosynthesis C-methylase UbiE